MNSTTPGCVVNIGPRQRRRRLIAGSLFAVLTLATAVWLVRSGLPRPWRLLVYAPAWAAAVALLQVKAQTCVLLAARGVRNMDEGEEPVGDERERRRLRAQARAVGLQARVVATAVTVLLFSL